MKRAALTILVIVILAWPRSAQAQDDGTSFVRFLPATYSGMDQTIYNAAWDILNQAGPWLPVGVEAYAPTYVSDYGGGFYMVSLSGLVGVGLDGRWNVDHNAVWEGNLMLHFDGETYTGGLQGSPEFNRLVEASPLSETAKKVFYPGFKSAASFSGDPSPRLAPDQDFLFFPWAGGKSVLYGPLGVHGTQNGRRAAVDFVSWIDNNGGMAPNALYASEPGTIVYTCFDDYQAGLKVSGTLNQIYYLHIFPMSKAYRVGDTVGLHEFLGNLQVGTFDDYCGSTDQVADHWHVHFVFDFNEYWELRIENWVLSESSEKWTYYTGVNRDPGEILGPADWSGWAPPPAPPTPLPTLTPGGPTQTPGGPTATPSPPKPPQPGDGNNGTNFWSFLLTGAIYMRDRFLSFLPTHEALDLAQTVLLYAAIPIKIVWTFGLVRFTLPIILIIAVLFLELVRFFMSLYRLVLKNIPVAG